MAQLEGVGLNNVLLVEVSTGTVTGAYFERELRGHARVRLLHA